MNPSSHEPEYVRPYSILAGILSYLIPGLGQMSQGRFGKGLLFFVCLLGLFHVGQAMGGWKNVYIPRESEFEWDQPQNKNPIRSIINYRWHYAGQFWIGIAAWPAIWQYYGGAVPSAETSPFLNRYQKAPSERDELNPLFQESDKTVDLGWVYTVIAGMLNILVIYDAYAGPAYGPRMPKEGKGPQPGGGV